ncbi:PE-PPE domain-containing protein [Mycolicibacterium hodleri]|uniref:PE-PPE domain-containing protein n=1 Tax=Mycolicibacterium hodleri TaxID=49897 RepID=UPI0013758FDB|nr:PE-PPE domain-containing protein [Mycolicibacterium hodleri]
MQGTQVLPRLPGPMDDELQGAMCQGDNVCQSVEYPASRSRFSRPAGVLALTAALQEVDQPITIFAYSQGAEVVEGTLAEMTEHGNAPAAADLSIVLIGNPARRHGGIDVAFGGPAMPTSPFQVTDIVQQYDPIGDFPQNPFNMLALANALAGLLYVHADYANVSVDDPANISWTEGNTTYVFVPTEKLPLLAPLRQMGFNELADTLNAPLKQIVEAGYHRDLPTADAAGVSETAVPAATRKLVEQPAVSPKVDGGHGKRSVKRGLLKQIVRAGSDADLPAADAAVASPTAVTESAHESVERPTDSRKVDGGHQKRGAKPRHRERTAQSRLAR